MEEPRLPAPLNPNNFPAKLWRLVNSPRFPSIRWDSRGEGLLIDQPLFESELLGVGPGHPTGPDGDGVAGAADIFKTKNFASFVRQLNLYGFRKVVARPVGSVVGPGPGPGPGGGDDNGGSSTRPLHHFHSPHFRRDRPDLLVHLKRLTSANKEKLAAGLEVTSRPPNRFQRLLSMSPHGDPLLPPSTLGEAHRAGLLTVGQFHQPYHRDSLFPYSYISTSSQNYGTLPTKSLDQTPVPSRTWQGSLGLLPGHEASPTFPDKGIACPVFQKFPTEVTYTLRPVASLLPLQQGSQTVATSLPQYSSYTSSMQYSQAYYPTAAMQCFSPPAHTVPLTGSASPAASMYTHCSFFQSPPVQSPCAADLLPSDWPCNTSEENKETEIDLEAVFQMVDEMRSSPKAELVKVEPVESQCSTPQSNGGQPLLVNSENSDPPSSTEENQLEALIPIAPDTSFVMGADQAVTCSPSQPDEFLFATYTTASVESAAAEVVQESVTTQEACEKLREQPCRYPTQSSVMFVQEGPFSPEQSPPVQSPCAADLLPSDWPCNTSEENKETEIDLEAVFQMVDEMRSSPKAELVKVEPVESQCSTPQSNGGQPLLVNSENSDPPSSTEENQLEALIPIAPDTSFVMGADQAVTCSPSQPDEFLFATYTTASVESAAAEVVQESVTTQEACEKLREQPCRYPTQSSVMFVQEGPFSPEQSPPVQSPCAADLLPSDWPCNTSEENKETEIDLEAVFQMVDEMRSSPKAELVKVEPVESQCSTPQSNGGQPLLVNSENSDPPSSTEENQLEALIPIAPDTSFVMGADQAVTCSPSQPDEFLFATYTTASVESAAAEVVQESVTTQEACEKLREQPCRYPTQSSVMFVQEGPFSPEQENTSVKCESSTSEMEERHFTSGTEPVNKSVEGTDSSVKPGCRKRRHSSHNSKSPDLHLLVDVACKQGCFRQEETRE